MGRLTAWAAVTVWAEAAYLAGVAVVYGITARQAVWGGPLWWPVAVAAATAAAACAVGFAAGALAPSRFTAPMAAVVVFLALGAGAFALQHGARPTYSQIWPLNVQGAFPPDFFGIFYPYLPDLALAQIMFVGGIGVAALGALGLPKVAGGRWLRSIAAAATIAGLGAAGLAVGLAGTARLAANGVVIPALHDAASDRPVPYTPVCGNATIPVCLQPAYRPDLPQVTAALHPLLQELAGLPGAPARVTQVAVTSIQQSSGGDNGIGFGGPVLRHGVLYLPLSGVSLPGEGTTASAFISQLRNNLLPFLNAFVGLSGGQIGAGANGQLLEGPPGSGAAQLAVGIVLADDADLINQSPPPGDGAATSSSRGNQPSASSVPGAQAQAQEAATRRFASLPAATRHAWLVTHLAALRASQITLSEIP